MAKGRRKKAYTSQGIGAAGELIVQAALLRRGWIAGNVNTGGMRNAPAVDVVAMKQKHDVRIAVKSCGPSACSQWNLKPGWKSLFKGKTKPDFIAFVWFTDDRRPDEFRLFLVPAKIADRKVRQSNSYWYRVRNRTEHASHVAIWWLGKDSDRSTSRDFARKWKQYENNWRQMEARSKRQTPASF